MTSASPNPRSGRFRFSLRHMLALTAIIAVWTAAILAFRANVLLTLKRAELIGLSSRLVVVDSSRLQAAAYPPVAKDVQTWEVHVPDGKPFELRFGVATVSRAGMLEPYENLPLAPGKHRITLRTADHVDEEYRYTVFVDGEPVFDKTMGRDWMPDGWRQASGLNAPIEMSDKAASMLHLAGEAYTPRINFELNTYFNGYSDEWVSQPGYRLWIDQADQTYPPVSPFIGFAIDPSYQGIGLRDGLRYRAAQDNPYEWAFHLPASQTREPALTIVPEFFVGQQMVLSDQTKQVAHWQLRNDSQGQAALAWEKDPTISAYTAFLHADVESADATEPVVELRWDASRPNDVGIRLPKTPANEELTKWRLRIVGGTSHLWRLLDVGSQPIDVRTGFAPPGADSFSEPLPIDLNPQSGDPYRIGWRTDVTMPLQFLERGKDKPQAYQAMNLFPGMPVAFAAEMVTSLQPQIKIVRAQKISDNPSVSVPGGPVIEELQIELDATTSEFLWLQAVPQ